MNFLLEINNYFLLFVIMACSYLIGSISFGIIITKLIGVDNLRSLGSGNIGETNVLRTGNKVAALLTLLGDMLKATIVITVANYMNLSEIHLAVISIPVLLGHIFPVYYKFRGGKGVATALGILLGINWMLALAVFFVWLFVFTIWRFSSLAAIVATFTAPIISYYLGFSSEILWLNIIISTIVIYRHKANITNLLNGKEHRFKK